MTTHEYPATQHTFINVYRNEAGQIEIAELWSGVGDFDDDKFLLDIYHSESIMDGTYGYAEEATYGEGADAITFPGQVHPEVLVCSWVTSPPSVPTLRVKDHSLWEQHIDMEIDIMLGK